MGAVGLVISPCSTVAGPLGYAIAAADAPAARAVEAAVLASTHFATGHRPGNALAEAIPQEI
eukprot:CAMPEP_0117693216 /NCGR_PEP_ID=MMETSP0804-20121206/26756_1 /TAXON_ID=1074897 /ORGANISM="Tetraselmis astigmatica, Strain CCMP880" /LENGTH=61 /DNA_ID=CAMNT_0005506743 /DNA_START=363 /DNA_END=548 /DNA_ORIENTATION=-